MDRNYILHILEQSAASFGLHINATKTEYMCYNQNCQMETLNKTPLKKVGDFVYLNSNIASTEKDVLIRILKAWSALDQLWTIWKSTFPEQTKEGFFMVIIESVWYDVVKNQANKWNTQI